MIFFPSFLGFLIFKIFSLFLNIQDENEEEEEFRLSFDGYINQVLEEMLEENYTFNFHIDPPPPIVEIQQLEDDENWVGFWEDGQWIDEIQSTAA